MPSKWVTDIAGFSFPSPSPRILVKEAMETLINAVYERDDPNIKNGATNYTSRQLSDANFIMQEFIDNCESCFAKYLNLNKVDGDSVTSSAHTWDKSSLIDANADGFVEMGLFNGEDYSFFSDFSQVGFFLSEDILKKCYEIIGLLKWRIGIKATTPNRSVGSGNHKFVLLDDLYTSMYDGTYPSAGGRFPPDVYQTGGASWAEAQNRMKYNTEDFDRVNAQIGRIGYNQSRNFLDGAGFVSGMSTRCVFNSGTISPSDTFNDFGSIYSNDKLNISSANEQADFYSLPFLVDVTPSSYETAISAINEDLLTRSCLLSGFQMFFDIDNDTVLDYYTP